MQDTPHGPDGRDALPRHTTPTWEMELLLSGATVFGLMQLPALLDAGLVALMPRFERDTGVLIMLPFVYLKSAVQILIVTFLLHLMLRGYWTALVGLRSVYPGGVDWAGLRWGPHYAELMRRRFAALPDLVEKADNRASQVFGFGIGFALALLAPLVLVGVTSVVAWGLHRLLGTASWRMPWYALMALLVVPYVAVAGFDRLFGKRLAPGSRAGRVLSAMLGFYLSIGFRSFANYPVMLFMSRYGKRRGGVMLMLAMFLLVSASMLGQLWDRLGGEVGQYGALSIAEAGRSRTVLPEHYADQRSRHGTLSPMPYIDSMVVRGDYLRLFIPYRPTRDNPALRRRCPQVLDAPVGEDAAGDSAAIAATLDCLALLYPIALDGIVIADPQFDLGDDRDTGLRGLLAMIRVADLPPGRHELEIRRPPDPARATDDPREVPYLIPFWR
jgi:hypothetical protein